jgi:hypothetical protein
MAFLRSLASTAAAGAVLAAGLVALLLLLNPGVEFMGEASALFAALFMPWFLGATAFLVALTLVSAAVRFWPQPSRPPLPGWPFFTTLMAFVTATGAALYWLNIVAYRDAIDVDASVALHISAWLLTASAVVLVAICVDAVAFPHRERVFAAPLVVLVPAMVVCVPLALRPTPRGPGRTPPVATEKLRPSRHIVIVGLDGLGYRRLSQGIAAGRLPTLSRLIRRGASGALAAVRPCEGPVAWTSLATGLLPRAHGVRSPSTYRLRGGGADWPLLPKGTLVSWFERFGLVTQRPLAGVARDRRTIWNIFNAIGADVGLVRLPGTHPPERVRGFVLSPYFHALAADPARAAEALYPADLAPEVLARFSAPADVDRALLDEFISPAAIGDQALALRRILAEDALAPDLTYWRAARVLRSAYGPSFFAVCLRGLDVTGHNFLRYSESDSFGNVRSEDVRSYGQVLPRYEALVDGWVGEVAATLRPEDLLVVVSAYGMEPVALWRRLADDLLGDPSRSGSHATAPAGVLIMVGDGVAPGITLSGARTVDLVPTLLYLAGLPVARDMDGRVLGEAISESFARDRPAAYIPSYESLAVTPTVGPVDVEDLPTLSDVEP